MTTMQAMLDGLSGVFTGATALFAGSVLLRGAVLLGLAAGCALGLRRAPAALRHHVWMLAMTGLLVLPLLAGTLPGWRVPLPERVSAFVPAAGAPGLPVAEADDQAAAPARTTFRDRTNAGREATSGVDHRRASVSPTAGPTADSALPALLLVTWAVGCIILLIRLGIGLVRAARLVRRARPVVDAEWMALVSRLSLKAGLGDGVRLVSSAEVNVPMAWGIMNPWLVLPVGFEAWPAERRRVVVLHELAHLRRRDCLAQALARLALALHWPNPLAWIATSRMTAEREQACDDAVLTSGVGGPSYAHHLVEIARGMSRAAQPARAAVAMARPSELENRVVAILDERRRRLAPGHRTMRIALAGLAALLLPVAAIQPDAARAALERPDVHPQATENEGAVERAVLPPRSEAGTESDGSEGRNSNSDASPEMSSDPRTTLDASLPQAPTPGDTIDERVYRALERALGSEDPEVRAQVAHTLGTIESPRGVDLLTPLVRSDADAKVREQAAWALGMIESAAAVPALASATQDAVDGVRGQAAWALGMIESADGVDPLLALLEDGNADVRNQAAWGLGMIESSDAVPGLAAAYADEASVEVRSQIIWALGMIEDRESADTIVDALEDPDPGVRKQALWALGQVLN
jgi:HEAT repeat protein